MMGFQTHLITVSLLPKHFWRYVVWRSTQGLLAFTIVINLKARIVIAAISYVCSSQKLSQNVDRVSLPWLQDQNLQSWPPCCRWGRHCRASNPLKIGEDMKRECIIDGTKKGQTLPVDNLVVMQVLAAQQDLENWREKFWFLGNYNFLRNLGNKCTDHHWWSKTDLMNKISRFRLRDRFSSLVQLHQASLPN